MSDIQTQIRRNRLAEVYVLLCEAADRAGPQAAGPVEPGPAAKTPQAARPADSPANTTLTFADEMEGSLSN